MTQNKRIKIPRATDSEVVYLSDRKCCVCQDKGVHIHHLEGKNNNNIDNLALLCFSCHDEASKTGSLSKKLSRETIVKYRDHHYLVIKNKRKEALGIFDEPIKTLSEEMLLTAAKNALIIFDLGKIEDKYFGASWEKKDEYLSEILKFHKHSNNRLAYDVFNFLEFAANETRHGMTEGVAMGIFSGVLHFFPSFYEDDNPEQTNQIAHLGIQIGNHIVYDSTIYLNNLEVAMHGLTILKFVYKSAKQHKRQEIIDEVIRTYDDIEQTLLRPERNDLGNAQELVKIFRKDLDEWSLSYPPLPEHLMEIVHNS